MNPLSLEKKTSERRGNEPPLSVAEFEAEIRAVGPERYHDLHQFHHLLHGGKLNKGQVQAWALNRYYYQSRIPMKDAALLSRCEDRELRREWLMPLVHCMPCSVGVGTTTPPGHMQNENTPRTSPSTADVADATGDGGEKFSSLRRRSSPNTPSR